ncbi:DUF4239 domain-containing protein [Polymorphobacter fuscus]|uniref:DUF4239 domain-containing protein n=1 Tax=Sandarakinorhabdus fusca TaxID=1439888 RepID=A0A7C9KJ91_9SPHN|nr:DUF4239 domain-containing protein [Polymorphobacter fuscus]KAB7648166.1 DUF4239 domain-containing protein [Polymorphobacter fuscus]MQT15663.1 DUF4239 domain-containing protein [Polymorphobacter fuscus]NJC08067.1 hypothetical protein [Polymorphobacter fuscus]
MHPLTVGAAAFVAIFGGALAGMAIARRLPDHHRDADSRNAILVAMAVVSTLSALVLSLLVTQANGSYSRRADAVAVLGTDIQRLDRSLRRYGPDSLPAHDALKAYALAKRDELAQGRVAGKSLDQLDRLTDSIVRLVPTDAEQRFLQQQAMGALQSISEARWRLAENADQPTPTAFLVLLIFWLTLLFTIFGLFSPRNGTVMAALLCCAVAVSSGVFLIVELATPNAGLLLTPTRPLTSAIAMMP